MSNGNGSPTRNTPVARNRYSEGQILHARDLERESDYFMVRDRQHNALAHGPGILTGLQLIAYEMGTEKAVQPGSLKQPKEIDVLITPGAAIDTTGRLVIVPKRVPLALEFAKRGGTFAPGTYRVELLYSYADAASSTSTNGNGCASASSVNGGSKLAEAYRIELTKFSPDAAAPQLDRGAVLDGPVDDPDVRAPIVLGLVDWNGADYVGYSATGRVYVPVVAERMEAPDSRAELELADDNRRLAFRTASLPAATAEDPFTPINMTDRFRIDENGVVWVPAEIGVGKDGVRFRSEGDPVSPEDSKWRMHTELSDPGAEFGLNDKGDALKKTDPYAPGRRELRVQFQRDGLSTGRQRVLIGHVDENGNDFQPALVVYDRPPQAGGTGTSTVEVWGDLYVRGTAWLNAAARRPPEVGAQDELDILLRQLAGPFAGAFRVFLTTDAKWLGDFATLMAGKIQSDATLNQQFVNSIVPTLLADNNFKQSVAALLDATIDAKVSAAFNANIDTVLTDQGKMTTALKTIADALDVGGGQPLPADPGARLIAALVRRLLRVFPAVRDSVHDAMNNGDEKTAVKYLFNSWITGIGIPGWTFTGYTPPIP